jgi:hypothetical protein
VHIDQCRTAKQPNQMHWLAGVQYLLMSMAVTGSECAGMALMQCPLRMSQYRTLSSKLPLTCAHASNNPVCSCFATEHSIHCHLHAQSWGHRACQAPKILQAQSSQNKKAQDAGILNVPEHCHGCETCNRRQSACALERFAISALTLDPIAPGKYRQTQLQHTAGRDSSIYRKCRFRDR